jgi:hypothetical protein
VRAPDEPLPVAADVALRPLGDHLVLCHLAPPPRLLTLPPTQTPTLTPTLTRTRRRTRTRTRTRARPGQVLRHPGQHRVGRVQAQPRLSQGAAVDVAGRYYSLLYYLLPTTYHLLLTAHFSLLAAYGVLLTTHHPPPTTHDPRPTTHHPLPTMAARRSSSARSCSRSSRCTPSTTRRCKLYRQTSAR